VPPLVVFLMTNYNSMRIIDVVKESLKSLAEIDYPRYEVIVADNASNDGSLAEIKKTLEKLHMSAKIVYNRRNTGYTGGINTAYAARRREAKYVAIMNNDFVINPNTFRELVEIIEQDESIGAVQGIILNHYNRSIIDTSGGVLTGFLKPLMLCHGEPPPCPQRVVVTSYPEGVFSLIRVKAIQQVNRGLDIVLQPEIFAYYDDVMLGAQLWNAGYRVVTVPLIVGSHARSATFRRMNPVQRYLLIRGHTIFNEVVKSRYQGLIRQLLLRGALLGVIAEKKAYRDPNPWIPSLAVRRGIALAKRIIRRIGGTLSLSKIPYIDVDIDEVLLAATTGLGFNYLKRLHGRKAVAKIATIYNYKSK